MRLAAVLGVLAFTLGFNQAADAQAVRFDSQALTVNSSCASGTCPVLAVPGSSVAFCTGTGTSCSGTAVTYTSAAANVACPGTSPITLPATNGQQCLSATDNQGNYGAWLLPGANYLYYVTYPASAGGGRYGPYPLSFNFVTGVTSFDTRVGAVTLQNSDVTSAVGQDLEASATTAFAGTTLNGGIITQNAGATNGSYMLWKPTTYNPGGGASCYDWYHNVVQQPVGAGTLPAFGPNDILLWSAISSDQPGSPIVEATSPTTVTPSPYSYPIPTPTLCSGTPLNVNTTYGLYTNGLMFAMGGFGTSAPGFNVIQAYFGGVAAAGLYSAGFYPAGTVAADPAYGTLSVPTYIGGVVTVGHSTADPQIGTVETVYNPLPAGFGIVQGEMYYSDSADCLKVANKAYVFNCVSSGGTAAGLTTQVQFNDGGVFGANANFTYDKTSGLLSVIAPSAGVAAIYAGTGYVQSDAGFYTPSTSANAVNAPNGTVASKDVTTTDTTYNAISAPSGGVQGLALFAARYTQSGSSAGVPTSVISFGAGALYYDTTSHCEMLFSDSSTWGCIGSGGGGTPGGSNTNIQYNNSGVFGGSPNFTWKNSSQLLTVTAASSGVAGISVITGYIQSDAGFYTTSAASTAVNVPNGTVASKDVTATDTPYNTISAASGGVNAKALFAAKYTQTGNGSTAPTPLVAFGSGALYYDTTNSCEELYDGSMWSCLALAGGSSTPGGPTSAVQYNAGSSMFGGSANFEWNNAGQLLTITASSSATAGLLVATGYVQSDAGFYTTSSTSTAIHAPNGTVESKDLTVSDTVYNTIQAPNGGIQALALFAANYIQSGNSAGTPTPIISFGAGALYYDTVNTCEELYNGSSWGCLGSGGGGSPGGANTNIQFNNSGSFGGSNNLTWSGTSLGVTGGENVSGSIDACKNGSSACATDTAGFYVGNTGVIQWSTSLGAIDIGNVFNISATGDIVTTGSSHHLGAGTGASGGLYVGVTQVIDGSLNGSFYNLSFSGTGPYTAGTAITISGSTISGNYTAGTGISITSGTISGNYTGGTGVTIAGASIAIGQAVGTGSSVTFNAGTFGGLLTANAGITAPSQGISGGSFAINGTTLIDGSKNISTTGYINTSAQFEVSGTPGHTGSTCSAWVGGICTAP